MQRKFLTLSLLTVICVPSSLYSADKTPKLESRLNAPLVRADRTFKVIPFEPLTQNRLKRQKQLEVKAHQGKSWIEFVVKDNDTLYSLVRASGLSLKDLFVVLHSGPEAENLKNLRPGHKIRIYAEDSAILEVVHQPNVQKEVRFKRKANKFIAQTLVDGIAVAKTIPQDKFSSKTFSAARPTQFFNSPRLSHFPMLASQHNTQLQRKLERTVANLHLTDEVKRKKLAIALVDITELDHPKLASLNGDEMMYAASLPKIAILLGAFVEIERGQLELDTANRDALTQMIRFSSNESATQMLNKVGNKRLQEILMSDRYKLYDPKHNGGLWVGKEYGKSPAFGRDPLHNLSHGATVLQAARFYYMLETGQLVSSQLTNEMKQMLSDPKIKHKFVKGLQDRPGSKIYRKSGTWRQWHADSALVEANGYKYIVVALAEDSHGGQWLADMIAPLHDLIVPNTYAQYTPK